MAFTSSVYQKMPVAAQNALVSVYGYYLRHKRFASAADLRASIAESRCWTPDQIAEYQSQALVRVLERCAAIPFYGQAWRESGIDVSRICHTDDLTRLPILPKETVRRRGRLLVAPDSRPYWIQYTSGSTGTPVVVHLNRRTYQLTHLLLADHEARCGIGPTDLRATFAGRMLQPAEDLAPPFWRYNRAERQMLFSAYHLTPSTLPYYVEELIKRKPAELIGYASAIATVAAHLNDSGQSGAIRPRVVITNSETVFSWQRETIGRAFACPVRDYYGSAEAVVFAAECEAGAYHFDPLLGVAEIVGDDGLPVGPGQMGKIVCTSLTNDVMPLVRYEIGDTAVRLEGRCRCGSAFPAASAIVGRIDDTILAPDGRAVGRIDHIFKGVEGIKECQVVQEATDLVRLVLVPDGGFDARQEQLLRHNTAVRLGSGVRVEIARVAKIPRTSAGKFRGVISKVTAAADRRSGSEVSSCR